MYIDTYYIYDGILVESFFFAFFFFFFFYSLFLTFPNKFSPRFFAFRVRFFEFYTYLHASTIISQSQCGFRGGGEGIECVKRIGNNVPFSALLGQTNANLFFFWQKTPTTGLFDFSVKSSEKRCLFPAISSTYCNIRVGRQKKTPYLPTYLHK